MDGNEGNERLFHTNQFVVATCSDQARVGTIGASAHHFMEWKDTAPAPQEEVAAGLKKKSLSRQELLVTGMLRPAQLLDIVRHFTLFMVVDGRTIKVVCRYQLGTPQRRRGRAGALVGQDQVGCAHRRVQTAISHGRAGRPAEDVAARSDYFTIIAGDGQHPTSELHVLIPALDEAEIVTTYHSNSRELHRRLLSWGFRRAMHWACGIDFTMEGIYLFPRKVAVDEIGLDTIPGDSFFFSFELIARALQRGHTLTVRPMLVRRREHGSSKVISVKRIEQISKEIWDFRRRLKAERPS